MKATNEIEACDVDFHRIFDAKMASLLKVFRNREWPFLIFLTSTVKKLQALFEN
jgi:hypothetical protein